MVQAAPGAERRRRAVLAGHTADERAARSLLADADSAVRAAAIAALGRMGRASAADVNRSLEDVDPGVRRRACEVAVTTPGADLGPVLADRDPEVAEAAAWAAGERGPASRALVGDLTAMAVDHGDPLCREAAVAALGAIGDRAGLAAILAATGDKPAVRRRAVIALAAFEGSDVDEALRRALADRDWQVRQAAEDLLDVRPGEGGTS